MSKKKSSKKKEEEEIILPTAFEKSIHGLDLYICPPDLEVNDLVAEVWKTTNKSTFYVLADASVPGGKDGKSQVRATRLHKAVKNIMGRSLHVVHNLHASNKTHKPVKPFGYFDMPKIPKALIDQIDALFHEVYDKIGTESIVMLTYDMDKRDSESPEDGWDFVVPEQSNSPAHCNYDPSTGFDEIDDDSVFVVGTCHSHPMMSAFCSGTDKGDQSNFDGIHITFGWSNNTNLKTAYHVEMEIGGASWEFDPSSVIDFIEEKTVLDERYSAKMDRIEKQQVKQFKGNRYGYGWEAWSEWDDDDKGKASSDTRKRATAYQPDFSGLPNGVPKPSAKSRIIVFTDEKKAPAKCIVCVKGTIVNHRCLTCLSYHMTTEYDTFDEFVEYRSKFIKDPALQDETDVALWALDLHNDEFYPMNMTAAFSAGEEVLDLDMDKDDDPKAVGA